MTLANPVLAETKIKNVIMLIGDGMGPQQMGLLEAYARQAPNSIYKGNPTSLSEITAASTVGLSMHNPADALVVDSAASASQLATGTFSPSEAIGVDARGDAVETVLELAKKEGRATGLVSDTRLTHATPAAFASHQPHRSLENEIAVNMLKSNSVDVMLSGGLRHWVPASVNEKGEAYESVQSMTGDAFSISSKRKDERNLLQEAKDQGYELAFDRKQLSSLEDGRVLGLFSNSGMMDGIVYSQTRNDEARKEPTLKEMTVKAIDLLEQNDKGFFLMVEGGQIDWAGHNNDAGTMLHEMIKFDETIKAVYEWAKGRDDTLVLVTADHETGSFGFSYSAANLPKAKKLPGEVFKGQDYKPMFNFGSVDILDAMYNQKKSFIEIMGEFYQRPAKEQTPGALAEVVNNNSDFDITAEQAANVLAMGENRFRDPEHSYLKDKELPVVKDFSAFYVYGSEIQYNLLGREMAEEQNVVWGTGTHTTTPVVVIAYGNEEAAKAFNGFMHHTDIGQRLKALY